MYLNGMKLAEIARTLKNEGILSPSQYRYFNIGDKEKFDKAKDWYYVQVKDILKDQQYVGDSVHGKSGGKLGEHRTKRRNDKEDWIIIPDTHEAIVSREEFAIVQKMISDSTKQFNDAINRGRQNHQYQRINLLGSVLVGNVVPEFLSSVRIQEKVSSIIIVQERKAAFCAGTGTSKFHMRI